jgi:hypothetical protein
MQKVMTVSNPADLRARVEIWLERVRSSSHSNGQTLHVVSYNGQRELQRRSVPLRDGGETLGASARRVCQEYCSGLGWQSSLLNLG